MRAMMRSQLSEQGQVLVIFVGGLVTLLLVAALVVDLGFAWMIQRREQNAADAGALAAARYIHPAGGGSADPTAMFNAACWYAYQDGFFSLASSYTNAASVCVPANDPAGTTLAVHWPPSAAAGPEFEGDKTKVEVQLSQPHQTFFARLAGQFVINVGVNAVASWDKGDAGSASLVSLDPHTCKAGQITGNSGVTIQPISGIANGGYIQINSDCSYGNATDNHCSNDGNGSFSVSGGAQVYAPYSALYTRGNCSVTSNSSYNGAVNESAGWVFDPLLSLKPPEPSPTGAYCTWTSPTTGTNPTGPTGSASHGCTFNGNGTIWDIYPGTYYGGWTIQQKPIVRLHPGIYIIAGGGITVNAQTGSVFESVAGTGGTPNDARILIFSTHNPNPACGGGSFCLQQDINFSANTSLYLQGLDSSPCPPISSTGCPYAGLLFWQDANGGNASPQVNISAGASMSISGTIYDPKGLVDLSGSSSTSGCTTGALTQNCASVQIISWQFNIDGGSGLFIPYDPNNYYHLPKKGLVK